MQMPLQYGLNTALGHCSALTKLLTFSSLVVEAFSNCGQKEYYFVYDHIGFDGDHSILFIWKSQGNGQSSSQRTSISYFAWFKAAEVAEIE